MQDVRRFHQRFYSTCDKVTQDNFILKHTTQETPKRNRVKNGKKKPQVMNTYFVATKSRGLVKVCSQTFLSILGISAFRVRHIGKLFFMEGCSPKERRGGDTQSKQHTGRRQAVRQFLSNLEAVESHYTREKTVKKYLPSDCSIRKLWSAYNKNETDGCKVKYNFFRDIFNYEFNYSFKTPATDACSECIRLRTQISTSTGLKKNEAMTQLTVHKMKSKAFYDLLRTDSDPTVLKLSFDCEKNLILPKVPDQSAYYSRQLYQYNCTVCVGSSTTPQSRDSVFIYSWLENERAKGSNEIASILFHFLCNWDLQNINKVELFCDGCPGQNKNITIVGMLGKWLSSDLCENVESVQITFPVVGHSFLPPDRVFGRIEKVVKKKDTIIQPEEYEDIFRQFGTVRSVGDDVPVCNWKLALTNVIKQPAQLHFKFAASKRFVLVKSHDRPKQILIKGEANYRTDLSEYKPFLKKGKRFGHICPDVLPNKVGVKHEKVKDVKALLRKHFGDDWETMENLVYYRQTLQELENQDEGESDVEERIWEESEELRI